MTIDWNELIHRYIVEEATDEEVRQLETALKADDALVGLYLRHMELDVALEAQAGSRDHVNEMLRVLPMVDNKPPTRWVAWRPLQAAAAGLLVGLCSATMVTAYAFPRISRPFLSLTSSSFEKTAGELSPSMPPDFDLWVGDGRAAGAENGIVPIHGSRMMRFVSPDSADDDTNALRVTIAQAVDMQRWRATLKSGNATVKCSAMFNGANVGDQPPTVYRIDVRAYAGDLSVLQKPFAERASHEIAHSLWRTKADGDTTGWQRVSASLIPPPETDFLLIELKVFRPALGDSLPSVASVHYLDDIRLSLATPNSTQTVSLTP